MALPTTRTEFKDYCLRRLGADVNKINVSSDQVDDRISDALALWEEFHKDATERTYIQHTVTAEEVISKEIDLPSTVYEVISTFPAGGSSLVGGGNPFTNVKYQIAMDSLWTLFNGGIVDYFSGMQQIDFYDDLFSERIPFSSNKFSDTLTIQDSLVEGQVVIIEVVQKLDTENSPLLWSDVWLRDYATAAIQWQWGQNLSKYESIPLLGGMTLNGGSILEKAEAKMTEMREQLETKYQALPMIEIG